MPTRDPKIIISKAAKMARYQVNLAKHHALERADRPPVVVFSWSKTGSSSAFQTLARSHLGRPVYHLHELDEDLEPRLARNALSGENLGLPAEEIRASRRIQGQIAAGDPRITLVTLIREPMSRAISSFFQRHHSSGIDMTGADPSPDAVAATVALLHEMLPQLITSTDDWFDRQMVPVFGLDLFEQPFDAEAGHATYRQPAFDQAVIRLDRFEQVYRPVLEPLLGHRVGKVRHTNVSSAKRYREHRRATLAQFRATPDEIDLAASTRVVGHYFTAAEREALVRSWRAEPGRADRSVGGSASRPPAA